VNVFGQGSDAATAQRTTMGRMIVTGTADGLHEIGLDGAVQRQTLPGTQVRQVSGDWAIADDVVVSLESGKAVDLPGGLVPRCLLADAGGTCLVGTSEARLFEVGQAGQGQPRAIQSFDLIPRRMEWSTPWGGAPDTRSIARSPDGGLLVNVHVGGVWRTEPRNQPRPGQQGQQGQGQGNGGQAPVQRQRQGQGPGVASGGSGWLEAVEASHDVHQVVSDGETVAVATGDGVGISRDGGATFSFTTAGLHAPYCRAVALSEGFVLVSASTGPGTTQACIYRRAVEAEGHPFLPLGEAGAGKLPRLFKQNIDTFELAAAGELVAVATPAGELFLSEDAGESWRRLNDALPGIRCVDFRI
jgi:hypothetical protein